MMIIFDFDQTLVDTSPVEHLRAARDWKGVMARVADLRVYEGISELLYGLHKKSATLAIVTKSPDMVPNAFKRQHGWPIDIVLGYHQVKRRKPDPEGIQLAMAKGKATPEDTYHVGDQPEDTMAARAAGVVAIGSAWGIADSAALRQSQPDQCFDTVAGLAKYLKVGI